MKVWKFFCGYVNIDIIGRYPERLVNSCIANGIRLANLRRVGDGLNADVSARELARLRPLARGSGVRICIVSKSGTVRCASFIRNNAVLAAALLVFTLIALLASTRLWFIRTETVEIPADEILSRLSELGVSIGSPRSGISTSKLAAALDSDPRIANAKVRLSGVTLTVTVSEAAGESSGGSESAPSSIFADRDCVIRFISATSGHAKASLGQAVKKGDLLISGDLSESKEGLRVKADGVVLGEVLYMVSAEAERCTDTVVRSGRHERVRAVCLFGNELLLSVPYGEYELEQINSVLMTSSMLPVFVREYECYELGTALLPDTDVGVEERARLAAQEKLNGLIPLDAEIVSVRTRCTVDDGGSAYAVVMVTTIEKIGFREEI